ncbi:V-type proton ATPase subunit c''2-like [Musa acuminata AAA Group]|uniref:V-type proton ATPase subunit c''2-like n=1 Tax=Musa acuminata AAA Group TaxID=214697 RepID=UPI0031D68134
MASSWSRALTQISPYTFASVGIAISIGVSVLGAAWGIYITGSSSIGAAIKAPRITSKNLIRNSFTAQISISNDRGITMKVNGDTNHDPSHPRAGQ